MRLETFREPLCQPAIAVTARRKTSPISVVFGRIAAVSWAGALRVALVKRPTSVYGGNRLCESGLYLSGGYVISNAVESGLLIVVGSQGEQEARVSVITWAMKSSLRTSRGRRPESGCQAGQFTDWPRASHIQIDPDLVSSGELLRELGPNVSLPGNKRRDAGHGSGPMRGWFQHFAKNWIHSLAK